MLHIEQQIGTQGLHSAYARGALQSFVMHRILHLYSICNFH